MQSGSSRRGFSIVEVLIALAIAAVASTVILTMITSLSTNMRNFDSKFNNTGLAQELRNGLLSAAQCTQMFAGKTIAPAADETDVSLTLPGTTGADQVIVAGNSPIPARRVFVRRLYLEKLVPSGTGPAGGPVYTSTLDLMSAVYDGARAPDDVGYQGMSFNKVVIGSVTLEMNAGNQVQSCQLTSNPDQACQNLGGTYAAGKCTMPVDAAQTCAALGGVMSNGKCGLSQATAADTCAALGGNMTAGKCALTTASSTTPTTAPATPTNPSPAATCASLGGTWNGSSCGLQAVSNDCNDGEHKTWSGGPYTTCEFECKNAHWVPGICVTNMGSN